eukprot:10727505-Ditylum_brightwellii.AAC.1
MSLQKQVSIAVGLQNGGNEKFWGSIFNELCVDVSPRMKIYFVQKDIAIEKRRINQKEKQKKREGMLRNSLIRCMWRTGK